MSKAKQYLTDPIQFMEDHYVLPELMQYIKLMWWQKDYILKPLFYDLDEKGERKYNIALLGMPKKDGKSAFAAGIGIYFMFCDEPYGEIIVAANARDQAAMIIYSKMRHAVQLDPDLAKATKPLRREKIEVYSTSTIARCVAHQFETAAGLNPNCTIFDELWAFSDRKFFDELTVVPTRKNPLIVIVTYAGYEEQGLLWDLYSDGLEGDTVIDTGDPEIIVKRAHRDKRMLMFWSNKNLADWKTPAYLEGQRRRLPPDVYARLHENRWVAAGSKFITISDIESLHSTPWVIQITPILDRPIHYIVATDLGLSDDRTARVVGHLDPVDNNVYIDNLRVWQGTPDEHVPIAEVEQDLVDCAQRFNTRTLVIDPWQMEYVIQRLKGYYNVIPFNFSSDMVHLSQTLVSVLRSKRLKSYNEPELDKELKDTIIRQTASGWRLDHPRRKHNDIVITIGMMLMEAVRSAFSTLDLPDDTAFMQYPVGFKNIRGKVF